MPRQGLTTETVTAVAALLAEEIGCENLTLHKLANRLNIKPASLYTHISGIEQLYVLLSELALKQLGTAMMDAVKEKKRGEVIRAMSVAYHDYAKQNPEMYRMIIKVPHSRSEQLVSAGKTSKLSCLKYCHNIRQINRKSYSSPDIITVFYMATFLWSKLASSCE